MDTIKTMKDFLIKFPLWEASSSIRVMKMLAEQAEKNIAIAVKEADQPGAVHEGEYPDEVCDTDGEWHTFLATYYECGSCIGLDYDEVKSEYKHLITQLTRRSAFLTIYGLFEHRMIGCLDFLKTRSNYNDELKNKGVIEKTQEILKKVYGAKNLSDTDHLTILRNIMVHNDGIAEKYNETLDKKTKKTDKEKRLLKSIRRAQGIEVNDYNTVIMRNDFLPYVISEFERYIKAIEEVVIDYENKNATQP